VSWPVTETFKSAVRRSHRRVSRVDVLVRGDLVGSIGTLPDGTSYGGVLSGSIEVERTTVRRRLSGLTVLDPDAMLTRTVAEGGIGWLTPWGNELRVWRGIEYDDGTQEMVPLGTFSIWDIDESFPEVSVTGYDRARTLNAMRFTQPYYIDRGTPLTTAVQQIIETRWPFGDLAYNFAETSFTTPSIMFEEQDEPWTRATKRLAAAGGYDLHFDPMGDVVMRPEPVTGTELQAVEEFREGADSVRLPGTSRSRSLESRYNGVIVTVESPDNVAAGAGTLRAEVWDDNPASPTYRGTWGERPRWYSNPWITTTDQAQAAGAGVLRSELGATDGFRLSIVPMVHLDVGDQVHAYIGPADIISAYQSLDRLTIPLGGGEMTCETRGSLPISDEGE
jgi:hypothetical protein